MERVAAGAMLSTPPATIIPMSRLRGALLALALVVAALPGTAVPAAGTKAAPAKVLAPSFVAMDAATGPRARRPRREHPAPDRLADEGDDRARRDRARRPREPSRRDAGRDTGRAVQRGPRPGRSYLRETLLWSALLVSSNDSATALAIDAGGGSLANFYALANAKARALGMTSTTYASPSGLDDVRNLSTALDQAVLARAALQNPTFAQIVATRTHWTKWAAPTRAKLWVNHNKMLGDDARHLRRQDGLDEPRGRLPDRGRAPRRPLRDRRRAPLAEHLDGHERAARRRVQPRLAGLAAALRADPEPGTYGSP